jgi:hypothetical protein
MQSTRERLDAELATDRLTQLTQRDIRLRANQFL